MKHIIPKGYLKGGAWRPVRLIELVTLIYNLKKGAETDDVGFEDANNTLESILNVLNKKVLLDPKVIESALCSSNLMDEKGLFFDIKGRTFDELVKDILQTDKFNRKYNWISSKDEIE